MIDVEVFGARAARGDAASSDDGEDLPSLSEIRRLCDLAAGAAGVREGHLAIEFVDERRIAELNAEHRSLAEPTDVLSFPIDGVEPSPGARELGDVVICLAHTADVREAVVHGVLHLLGMDHETDDGQMLQLQRELLAQGHR
ncbi:MAG TPA: rRNA maturation RNase YbeY [Solirubrobacteraceae bacterium]|jgi:probable rRNA maturation factor|nr:rRNA maturation RNase YbeY [Solirubrobacteraceae bacterium]